MLKIKNPKKLIAILATGIVLSSFTGCGKTIINTPDDYVEISSDDESVNELDRLGVELKEFSLTEDFNIYQVMSFDDSFKEYTTNNIINNVNPYYTYDKYIAPNEFSEITGIKNTEWDDIRTAVEKLNTTQEYKDIIYRGINNLENSNFNTNLDLLLYNLSDLKIEEVNDTGLERTADNPAYFNPEEKSIIVNRNIECNFEAVFNHELFGHGMTTAVVYNDNKKIRCSTYTLVCTFVNGNYTGKELIGYSYEESLAELIATKANGKKDDTVSTVYSLSMYLFTSLFLWYNISR